MRHGARILLLMLIIFPVQWAEPPLDARPAVLSKANMHYMQGEFEAALKYFEIAVRENPTWIKRNPVILTKMAMAYFYTGEYARAERLLKWLQDQMPLIKDYLMYFELQAHLEQNKPLSIPAIQQVEKALQGSPLQIYVDSLLAEQYWNYVKKDSAFFFFTRMTRKRQLGEAQLLQRWIRRCDSAKAIQLKQQLALSYLKRFPFTDFALEAAKTVQSSLRSSPEEKVFRRLFRFYLQRKQFKEARTLLTQLKGKLLNRNHYAKYFIQLKYAQGDYHHLLQWLKQNRSRYTDLSVLQVFDLHLARCYLRTGQIKSAIRAYLTFQRRYPTARMAPEVLWKVASLYENRKAFSSAQKIYRKLVQQYPRSEFFQEAILRIGLIDYRNNQFAQARKYWASLLPRISNEDFAIRLRFWIAKAYLAEGNLSASWNMFSRIARNPFQNYYTLKAYLIMRDHPLHDPQIDSLVWSIPFQQKSTLSRYFHQFKRFWMIHQIWKEPFSRREFQELRRKGIPGWEYYYALGELAEKVGWHDMAFAVYRDVYFSFFRNKDWPTWRFLLKKLYPFYFQTEVDSAARRWQVPPAMIWAVMKKESSFQRDAVSYANAHGLMQLIPPTARQMGKIVGISIPDVRTLYNPTVNILLGTAYLNQLRHRFENNWYSVLAAYNAGPHRAVRWRRALQTNDDDLFMETIEFEQTRRYVRVVMRYYWVYSLLLRPDEAPEEILARR